MKNKKVLFIQTAFIGDVILFTSILESWKDSHPDNKVDVLVRKGNEVLLENNPIIDHIYIWDKRNSKYKNLISISREIRLKKYDLVINFQRFFASGYITIRSKAKETRGYQKNPLSRFFTKKFEHDIGNGKHETERNFELIRDLVDRSSPAKPKLYPSASDREKVKEYQKDTYVVMAPTSVWFTKQLPMEKWSDLISMIPENYSIHLIGAPGDKDLCDQLIRQSSRKNIFNLSGRLNLIQSAALIEKAKMTYVNDSAPLHLASATNAPTTAFFCSTIPNFGFGPLADQTAISEVEEDLTCRPCGLHGFKECPKSHFKCGYDINLKTNLDA